MRMSKRARLTSTHSMARAISSWWTRWSVPARTSTSPISGARDLNRPPESAPLPAATTVDIIPCHDETSALRMCSTPLLSWMTS